MRSRFGNIEKLPSGRYRARYFRDGKWHNADRTFRDHQIAQDWLDDQNVDRRRGTWVDPRGGKETFRALAGIWKGSQVTLRASTRDRDFGYLERYAVSSFGERKLSEIDHVLLSEWVAELSSRLAPATVGKALQIVSKVLSFAVQAKMLPANPAATVKAPKIEREEMRFLSVPEIAELTKAMDERYRGVVAIGCWGGLRMSEIFGLRPHNLNLQTGATRVTENLVESRGHLYVERCKTRASVRTVTLPSVALRELEHNVDPGHIFEAPEGGPVRLSNWRKRYWIPAVKAAGLEPLRPHDMRHTCAALLIASGAQPLEVSRTLGHSSVAFTLDRYGHLYDEWGEQVASRLDQVAAAKHPTP